jgi:hypothetical protein
MQPFHSNVSSISSITGTRIGRSGEENKMKLSNLGSLFRLIAIVAVLGSPAAALAASGKFQKDVAVDGSAVVFVSNETGSITVRGGDVDKVTIRARIRISDRMARRDPQRAQEIINGIKRWPPITVEGNRIEITKVERRSYQKYASISYEIQVPRDSDIEVHSVSGNVVVSGVTGDVDAKSDTGEVTLADSQAEDEESAPAA